MRVISSRSRWPRRTVATSSTRTRPSARLAHHGAPQLLQVLELVQRADQVDRVAVPQRAAGLVDVLGAQGLRQIVQGQAQGGQPVLVGLDLDLGVEAAAHLGRGHATDRLQARLEPASAICRSSSSGRSPVKARRMIGSSEGSKRSTRGISASRGSSTRPSFSRTSIAGEVHRLVPLELQDHLGQAGRETERMSRTPGITPTASSIGRVTNCSTEIGAASGYSVWIVSVG